MIFVVGDRRGRKEVRGLNQLGLFDVTLVS